MSNLRIAARYAMCLVFTLTMHISDAFSLESVDTIIESSNECVILLHGLARSDRSMSKLQTKIMRSGYRVVNASYPSRNFPIAKLAVDTIAPAIDTCKQMQASHIHFVTHSLGGILVRQYLDKNTIENLRYVVMLGPPNQGSEVVDALKNFPGFKALNGPAGLQLGTGENGMPRELGPATFHVGIIAGDRTINLILSEILPKPNDGKVSVESTKLAGMADHIVMPVTHTFMMKNKNVIEQVLTFLKSGKFSHSHTKP